MPRSIAHLNVKWPGRCGHPPSGEGNEWIRTRGVAGLNYFSPLGQQLVFPSPHPLTPPNRIQPPLLSLKPVLYWANVCSLNILRTVRRTTIRFLIELLLRRTWFGQFDELCFVLNWLIMRCKVRPQLAPAEAQQTA